MKKLNFVNRHFCDQNGVYLDVSPEMFIKENKRYYQEVENYDWVEVADHLQGLEAILHRLREKETLRLIRKFGKGGKFLDAGCGTGLILRHLPPGSVGLDINPRNIKRARKYVPKAKLVLGDIKKMPFANQSFTTVICTEVLEHLLEPQKAIEEIFRVLAPGGILVGLVPNQNPIWRLRFLSSTHPGEPYHRLYRQSGIEALVRQPNKITKLQKKCLAMNIFFVAKKAGGDDGND